jgi:predicted transcriptional regulator
MAQRGKRLESWQQDRIRRMVRMMGIKGTARETGVSKNTVRKYVRGG